MSSAVSVSRLTSEAEVLRDLRASFDQSFAARPSPDEEARVRLIMIRCGDQMFAIQADQIIGLAKSKRIVPVPSRIPELLGIAGIRGVLVPVFDLARYVGLESRAEGLHRLVLTQRDQPIVLAFDDFEGQVDVAKDAIFSEEQSVERGPGRVLARIGNTVCPLIDVAQIVEALRKRAGLAGTGRSESS